jgi:hypothetical protein
MSRRTHPSLPINRVISISWKRGICPQELEEKRWLIGGDMEGLQFLTLYCEHKANDEGCRMSPVS